MTMEAMPYEPAPSTVTGAVETASTLSTPSASRAFSAVSAGVGKLPLRGPVKMKSAATLRSIVSCTEDFIVAPSIPMVVTSVIPSVSAKAVAAVRRGLRRELVAARRPTAPNGAPTARPNAGTTGMVNAGPARK